MQPGGQTWRVTLRTPWCLCCRTGGASALPSALPSDSAGKTRRTPDVHHEYGCVNLSHLCNQCCFDAKMQSQHISSSHYRETKAVQRGERKTPERTHFVALKLLSSLHSCPNIGCPASLPPVNQGNWGTSSPTVLANVNHDDPVLSVCKRVLADLKKSETDWHKDRRKSYHFTLTSEVNKLLVLALPSKYRCRMLMEAASDWLTEMWFILFPGDIYSKWKWLWSVQYFIEVEGEKKCFNQLWMCLAWFT